MTKTLTQIAIDSISKNNEFKLLNRYSNELFDKDTSINYINYSLDYYNANKYKGHLMALRESLIETILYMKDDYEYLLSMKNKFQI